MESILTGNGTDQRHPELDVSVYQDQASYILRRDQTTTTCATPVISPNGVRTAKLNIVDGNFLDLSTLCFSFVIHNTGAQPLQPLSAIPHCWWRRALVKFSGSAVEDVQNLSRLEEQISRFVSTNKRRNWGDAGTGWSALTDDGRDAISETIPAGGSRRVVWRPLSLGFLQCGKYLPMLSGQSGGLQFEMEVADATEAVLNCSVAGKETSTQWQLEQVQAHVDSVTLASELNNSYADLLVRGESILIPYQANTCDILYCDGSSQQVLSIAKQYSRLATLFVSLESDPENITDNDVANVRKKSMNNFYSPAKAGNHGEDFASYISAQNMRWPQFDTTGMRHHFMRLMQGIGVLNSASHSVNISKTG